MRSYTSYSIYSIYSIHTTSYSRRSNATFFPPVFPCPSLTIQFCFRLFLITSIAAIRVATCHRSRVDLDQKNKEHFRIGCIAVALFGEHKRFDRVAARRFQSMNDRAHVRQEILPSIVSHNFQACSIRRNQFLKQKVEKENKNIIDKSTNLKIESTINLRC